MPVLSREEAGKVGGKTFRLQNSDGDGLGPEPCWRSGLTLARKSNSTQEHRCTPSLSPSLLGLEKSGF